MVSFSRSVMLLLVCNFLFQSTDAIYQSNIQLSSTGFEFQPKLSGQLLSTTISQSKIRCSTACNQLTACRTFDYDLVSQRCRLFEADATTGSVITSSSSSSIVGTVRVSSTLYSSTHNQPCQKCQQTRYEVCNANASICQCPSHTYWNESVCALQLFENDTCVPGNSCRSDLNLTCTSNCYGEPYTCSPTDGSMSSSSMRYGVTVAGACNGSSSTNQTPLDQLAGLLIDFNNILYFGDNSYQLLALDLNNRTVRALGNYSSWPDFLFYDNRTASIYITVFEENLAYIWPSNETIPSSGLAYTTCSLLWLHLPTGIVVDSMGNVYISSYSCNWIMQWAPNATTATIVAGSSVGTPGNDSLSLNAPYNLALDESNSFIYVADRNNHRIQRFVLGGNGVAVTVAGGNGPGLAANQLNRPSDIYVSRVDGSLYIADCDNNRIQKWRKNATSGITIAGSSNGTAGSTPYLLNSAYSLAIDPEENYLYVTDANNNRIQRFSLQ